MAKEMKKVPVKTATKKTVVKKAVVKKTTVTNKKVNKPEPICKKENNLRKKLKTKKVAEDEKFILMPIYEAILPRAAALNTSKEFIAGLCNICNIAVNYPAIIPTKVIFNDPATIVFWEDGTKTVARCQKGDKYNKEVGLNVCFAKRICGRNYQTIMEHFLN